MSLATAGIVFALLTGGVRAVELWRAGGRVEVTNVAVVSAFAKGRVAALSELLKASGPAVYLAVAAAIADSAERFLADLADEAPSAPGTEAVPPALRAALVEQVERDARVALIAAHRRLRKHSWLDTVTVLGLVYAGVQFAVYGPASMMQVLGMLGATLLWLANVWGCRFHARRVAWGATVLVEMLPRTLREFGPNLLGRENEPCTIATVRSDRSG